MGPSGITRGVCGKFTTFDVNHERLRVPSTGIFHALVIRRKLGKS